MLLALHLAPCLTNSKCSVDTALLWASGTVRVMVTPGLTESKVHPGLHGTPLISWAGYGPLAVGSLGEEGTVGPWKPPYALP